jgi:putative hemolysin
VARLAQSAEEMRRAQRLRFEVFNLELNEGLVESHFTGLDVDLFDNVCDHLIVEYVATGEVVGTYRLQTGARAAANIGYYSEREFDFAPYEPFRFEMIELGRACVHAEHRNLNLLQLLWRGIAIYAIERKARFLIGCSSLTSQDPVEGAAMYQRLRSRFLVKPAWQTFPHPVFELRVNALVLPGPPPPKLLRTYLSIGAKICGPPAFDREFGTIDFLTLLDLHALPAIVRAHFLK